MSLSRQRGHQSNAAGGALHSLGFADSSLTHHFDFTRPETMTEVTTELQPTIDFLFFVFGVFGIRFLTAHSLSVGDVVAIEGATDLLWNRNFTVTAVQTTTQILLNSGSASEDPTSATCKKITSSNKGKRWINLGNETGDFAEAVNALTNGPTYPGPTRFNGRDTVEFKKGSQIININIATSIPQPLTIMAVLKRDFSGASTGFRTYAQQTGTLGGTHFLFFGSHVWQFGSMVVGPFGTAAIHVSIDTVQPAAMGVDFFFTNQTFLTLGQAGDDPVDGMILGGVASQLDNQNLDGSLAEIAILSKTLTLAERLAIVNVWGKKYNISGAR